MTQSHRNPALRRSCVKLLHSCCDSPHSCVVPSAIGCLWGTLPSNGKKLYMAIFIIQVCGLLNQRNCLHLCLTAIFQSTIPHLLQPCKKLWLSGEKVSSLVAQMAQCLPAMQETWVRSLDWKDPWRRKWQPTPISLPGKSHDGGAWWATVHGVTESRTRLSDFTFFHFLSREEIFFHRWLSILRREKELELY